jgi:hypothetical protein
MALMAVTSTDKDTGINHIFSLDSSIYFIGKVKRCTANLKEATFLLLQSDSPLACHHLQSSIHARTHKPRALYNVDITLYD